MTDGDRDGVFDDVDPVPIGELDDYKGKANSLLSTHEDVSDALQSAVWHTIIDDAGHEAFVDDLTSGSLRDAIQYCRSNGFAVDRLTAPQLQGDEVPDGAGFFAGSEAYADYFDELIAFDVAPDSAVRQGGIMPEFDGYPVRETDGLPSKLIVFVDVGALARVPVEGREINMESDSAVSVSSPIVVKHSDGIAVVNIDE